MVSRLQYRGRCSPDKKHKKGPLAGRACRTSRVESFETSIVFGDPYGVSPILEKFEKVDGSFRIPPSSSSPKEHFVFVFVFRNMVVFQFLCKGYMLWFSRAQLEVLCRFSRLLCRWNDENIYMMRNNNQTQVGQLTSPTPGRLSLGMLETPHDQG